MEGWIRFRPGEQLGVVVEGQARVQAVDDVDLGDRVGGGDARAQPPERLLVRHRVGAGVADLEARERAEHAARLADVGGVDVQVAVEVGAVAVQPLAHLVGERADLEEVRVLVQARRRLRGTAARPRAPCRGSQRRLMGRPPAATRRPCRSQGSRPAPRISVTASLRVSDGLLAFAPRRSARSATIGAKSSSAPKPNAICARRGPSIVTSASTCPTRGSASRQSAKQRSVSRPNGSPTGPGMTPKGAVAAAAISASRSRRSVSLSPSLNANRTIPSFSGGRGPHEESASGPAGVARRRRLAARARTGPAPPAPRARPRRGVNLRSRTRSLVLSFSFFVSLSCAPAGHQLVGQPELVEHAPDHGVQ